MATHVGLSKDRLARLVGGELWLGLTFPCTRLKYLCFFTRGKIERYGERVGDGRKLGKGQRDRTGKESRRGDRREGQTGSKYHLQSKGS